MSDTDFDNPRQRRTSTIVVIGVVCVAVGAVMAMRFLSPRGATAGDPEVDRKIDEVLKREAENPSGPEFVIEVFPGGPVAPESGPPRNPFVGEGPRNVPPSPTPEKTRREEIGQAARQLRLQAIMTGRHPVATINGRAVGLNSVFRVSAGESRRPVELRVVSISQSSVALVAEDPELDLTVEVILHLNRP